MSECESAVNHCLQMLTPLLLTDDDFGPGLQMLKLRLPFSKVSISDLEDGHWKACTGVKPGKSDMLLSNLCGAKQ